MDEVVKAPPATTRSIPFRTALVALVDRLGKHQLSICERAQEIHDLIEPDAVHPDLVRRIVRTIYKANRCCHLDAPIYIEPTLDSIGAVRGTLLRRSGTDVQQLDLVDEIGLHLVGLFNASPPAAPGPRRAIAPATETPRSDEARR